MEFPSNKTRIRESDWPKYSTVYTVREIWTAAVCCNATNTRCVCIMVYERAWEKEGEKYCLGGNAGVALQQQERL